jgi:4'-phosphopantetheinyl transferase
MRLPANNAVHVWIGRLGKDGCHREWNLLSLDERTRAKQFHFERDRVKFVRGRAALRRLLGDYLEIAPGVVGFHYGEYGKPELDAGERCRLRFNVTHSGDVVAIAVTGGPAVGIDVEQTRPLADLDSLARTCFSEHELMEFYELPVKTRLAAFYSGWTRKEALLKALGSGLHYPLTDFDVTLDVNRPACLLRIHMDPAAAERWQLHAFQPTTDYAGAVAVERIGGAAATFEWYQLPGSGQASA